MGITFLIAYTGVLPCLFLILGEEHECRCKWGGKGQNHNLFEDVLAQLDQSVSGGLGLSTPTALPALPQK